MNDSTWYPDSGVTAHLTNDATRLTHTQPYIIGKVIIGDGRKILILHTGSSFLTSGSNKLLIKDLLHVPQIHKSLLSVSKFAKDNHVYFEFHPTCSYVKDLVTHQILLQGPECEGLN